MRRFHLAEESVARTPMPMYDHSFDHRKIGNFRADADLSSWSKANA
jgi:hypothetical protein